MSIKSQFSIHAVNYEEYNLIQRKVVEYLLTKTTSRPTSILDLGCGTGGLYKSIDWMVDDFYAVDFSEEMLLIHPKNSGVKCIAGDFNDSMLFDKLSQYKIDHIFSASALQWSTDLNASLKFIKKLDAPISLAIFTANTFKTMFETANIPPILRTVKEVTDITKKYFNAQYETVNYKLHFDTTQEMFRYIKKSGVSAGRNILDYKRTKALLNNYPIDYLEFEVLFIIE